MAYNFTNYDGTVTFNIPDGDFDSTTDLRLAGPNYIGYGQKLNENLVYILENFAGNAAPNTGNSLRGQLWFDKSTQTLKVFTTDGYQPVAGATVSNSEPTIVRNGDFWLNTTTNQLKVYDVNESVWKLVGPQYTKAQGVSGAIPTEIVDTGSVSHNVVQIKYGNTIIAIISSDGTFAPLVPISGFATINPGVNINSTITGAITNTDVVGNLTGNVTGTVTGRLLGTVSGDVDSVTSRATNFSSGNAQISGGSATGLLNLNTTNFSASNILVTGGSLSGLTALAVTTATATNLSSSNLVVSGGYISALANITATTGAFTSVTATSTRSTNLSSSNVIITGGYASGLANISATTATATNLSASNILVTGGSLTGLSNVVSTNATFTNANATTITVMGGTINNVTMSVPTINNATLNYATANTPELTNSSTRVVNTALLHGVVPNGIIVMWGGSALSIPTGWYLCDGTNGTPDLRDRFIVGAGAPGSNYSIGDVGGANTTTIATGNLPAHTHGAGTLAGSTGFAGAHTHSVTDPAHQHNVDQLFSQYDDAYNNTAPIDRNGSSFQYYTSAGNDNDGDSGNPIWFYTRTYPATTGVSVQSVVDHVHTVSITGNTASAGSGTAIDRRPPYYALCYIQKNMSDPYA
ncbi:hypothetical protein UFOVP190_52 [uncultured Caudovirales phage]|uniref:Phage tail collar domain containing protein n=1 Tax=uncultured Caudovirales phage TaxID=2100421 RepID=A0A6J7WJU1_9CAUD|nr:hypothetical protein UFOVP190_52 [uncultured Caudovirales phage]